MMKNFKQGEYVYIPSNVLLFRIDIDQKKDLTDFEECKLMEKPQHLMFINESKVDRNWAQVFYKGELWTVKKENIYEIEEEE